MSDQKQAASLLLGFVVLAVAGGGAVWAFPLQAPAAREDRSIRIESGEENLLHRAPVEYPQEAREKQIEGPIVLELAVNEKGLVSDARVVSGPEELRRAALESVLQWHYSKDMSLPAKVQVTIQFRLPTASTGLQSVLESGPDAFPRDMGVLKRIEMGDLPKALQDGLRSRIPVREGDAMGNDAIRRIRQSVFETDEHLSVAYRTTAEGTTVRISLPPNAKAKSPMSAVRTNTIAQDGQLLDQRPPVYPPLAKQARIQGLVRLQATIGKTGRVENLEVISGHPLLVSAALDAVKQWVYRPTLSNGEPVEVVTQIDVEFKLPVE